MPSQKTASRDRRHVGGIEDAVGAHARVEVLVEGFDADRPRAPRRRGRSRRSARRRRRRWRRPRRRRAGREAGPRRGRSGSAPARRRAAGAATPSGRRAGRSAARRSDVHPLVQRFACCRDRRRARRRSCATRGSCQARRKLAQTCASGSLPQVAADEGQRVDELHQAVGQHDQQRRRMLRGGSAAPRAAPPRGSSRACARGTRGAWRASVRKYSTYCVVGHREVAPGLDRVAGEHRAAGVEAEAPSSKARSTMRVGLVDVEARRREVDLDRHARGARGCGCRRRSRSNSPRTRMRPKVALEAPSRLTWTAFTPRSFRRAQFSGDRGSGRWSRS